MTDTLHAQHLNTHGGRGQKAGLLNIVITHFRDQVTLSDLTPDQMDDTGLDPVDIEAALQVSLWEKLADHLQVSRS